jgi:arginyl-tRNA synthetase
MIEEKIEKVLLTNAKIWFGEEINASQIQLQKTRKDFKGDVTLVAFPFAKLLKKSPADTAQELGVLLQNAIEEIAGFNVVQGFLNIEIDAKYWVDQLHTMSSVADFGTVQTPTVKTFMVEYSSPNTNKPLHLGHLRNIFLGDSVAKILQAAGHKVIRTQIINDRGIHICKSMLAWQKFAPLDTSGQRETPQNTGIKGDKFVGKYYVEFDKALKVETNAVLESWNVGNFDGFDTTIVERVKPMFVAMKEKDEEKAKAAIYDKIVEQAKNATDLMQEAKNMLMRWEGRDPEIYLLWNTMNGWVYEGFNATYDKMGVSFDKLYYESDTFVLGKDVVQEGLQKGVFFRKDDGSVWIDLTEDGLDEKLVLRSDGTAVYMTQDIGTAIERYRDFPDLSGIIYTVGNEQDYHFKVLFLILKKLDYSWAEACYHLSYGMVDLPTGKMKSREGTVVDADDLMQEVIDAATASTQERGHIENMSEAERQHLFQTIGLGGLKYYLLKVDPKKRMLFNPEESIDLQGNTGPFIQYAYARIQSLLSKTSKPEVQSLNALEENELNLIKELSEFPKVLLSAAQNYSPAELANYTYELVKSYNQFYQSVPSIVNETDEAQKALRVNISYALGQVVKKAMGMLGIEVPERM